MPWHCGLGCLVLLVSLVSLVSLWLGILALVVCIIGAFVISPELREFWVAVHCLASESPFSYSLVGYPGILATEAYA
jgi:hypothetical protein